LNAGLAVWNYCQASAKYIFPNDEPGNALADTLLKMIVATPGIGRKAMYDALNRNVPSEQMAEALAWLRDHGKVYPVVDKSKPGRPVERWYPGLPTPGNGERPNALNALNALSADDAHGDKAFKAYKALGRNDVTPSDASKPRQGEGERLPLTPEYPTMTGRIADAVVPMADKVLSSPGIGRADPSAYADATPGRQDCARASDAMPEGSEQRQREEVLSTVILTPSLTPALPKLTPKPRLTPKQQWDHDAWLEQYNAAQAERLARERELREGEEMSDDEFFALLRAMPSR